MDRRRDGATRRRRTSLDMKSHHRKVSHTPTCAHTCQRVDGKLPEKSGVWQRVGSYFPARFPLTCRSASCASEYEVSGRRRAGWKNHRRQGDPTVATARRYDDGGFRKDNKGTERKHDHRRSKLGFPIWL